MNEREALAALAELADAAKRYGAAVGVRGVRFDGPAPDRLRAVLLGAVARADAVLSSPPAPASTNPVLEGAALRVLETLDAIDAHESTKPDPYTDENRAAHCALGFDLWRELRAAREALRAIIAGEREARVGPPAGVTETVLPFPPIETRGEIPRR
jgi:hypothetical protein